MTPTPDKIKERARYYTLGRIGALIGNEHFTAFMYGCSPLEALHDLSSLMQEDFSDLTEDDAEMILRIIAFGLSQQWGQVEPPEFFVALGTSEAVPVPNWRDAQ